MNELAVILPAYKSRYLEETLESFCLQNNQGFHIYIGDDCSPENLHEIVEKYESRLQITYRRFDSNLGSKDLVAHWERCIGMAKDERWIWLFSDDDIAEPSCVESFYESVALHPSAELFHFNIKMKDECDGGRIQTLPKFPDKLSAGKYLELKLRGQLISFVVEFIFSRELYERVGGFKHFDLAWGSDFMTWLIMAANTPDGIVTIDKPDSSVLWRKSGLNISPDKSRPILIRKIKSLIDNASVIRHELKTFPQKYRPTEFSFRWIRFPLGEIWRNRRQLRPYDILNLMGSYVRMLGRPVD